MLLRWYQFSRWWAWAEIDLSFLLKLKPYSWIDVLMLFDNGMETVSEGQLLHLLTNPVAISEGMCAVKLLRQSRLVLTLDRRHRIDKYLDTLLAVKQLGRRCHWQLTLPEVVIARWRTARVIISLFLPNLSHQSSFAVIGYAEAGRHRSPMRCWCCNVKR